MRKLYLASIKFKVGNNEFEETRLVASEAKTIEQVSDEAHKTWECEASGTDRVLKNLQISKTLNISDYVDSHKEQKQNDKYVTVGKEWLLNALYYFWNRTSDACPVDASEMEEQIISWKKFVDSYLSKQIQE